MAANSLNIFCDGGARGNPGPAASAFFAEEEGKIIFSQSLFLGKATNNAAEYESAIIALKWLVESNAFKKYKKIFIYLDSQLIMKQLNNLFKIKNENLRSLYFAAKDLEKKISTEIVYRHVRREKNKLADLLVNRCLDKKVSRTSKF